MKFWTKQKFRTSLGYFDETSNNNLIGLKIRNSGKFVKLCDEQLIHSEKSLQSWIFSNLVFRETFIENSMVLFDQEKKNLKVSKFQKQILLFSFEPKTE